MKFFCSIKNYLGVFLKKTLSKRINTRICPATFQQGISVIRFP
jgi:hypothetical protein